ncbi:MAG: hypothetical protein DMG21_21360 [Acidobacteria bacterium]|nr:MAG: hypothetical protein DMG21_21360 [Acidobacteriota bacterium]
MRGSLGCSGELRLAAPKKSIAAIHQPAASSHPPLTCGEAQLAATAAESFYAHRTVFYTRARRGA